MWSKSNWCERIIFVSLFGLITLVSYNLIFQQVISNVWLILYTLLIIIFTIWLSCRDIQFLLEQSVPLKTEPNDALAQYSQISVLKILYHTVKKFLCLEMCPKRSNVEFKASNESKKAVFVYSTSDVSVISNVIENKCIWSWYSQYVSKEVEFPSACKQLLEQMVSKVFQISSNIDTVSFYSDALGAFLRHCKEYKRAQKRMAKIGQGRIEEYYRCTHPTSPQRNSLTTCMRGKSTQSHCLLLVRCFLKELLPWELWGTPQSLLLASILAKRLDEYITTSLSNPAWIKFRLMNVINPEFKIKDIKLADANCTNEIKPTAKQEIIKDLDSSSTPECPTLEAEKALTDLVVKPAEPAPPNIEDQASKSSIESALSNLISSSTAPILQRAEIDDANSKLLLQANPVDKINIKSKASQPINISASPAHTKKLNNSNEVKIYDKVLDGSVKTWNSDNDLECVSLGHDLLASLDGDIETRFGRLWEADGVDGSESWSPNPPSTGSSTKTPHGLWFGEEDNLDMDLTDESPPKQNTTNNHQTNNVSHNNPNTVHTNSNHSFNNSSSNTISNFNMSNPLSIQNMKELQNISKNTVNHAKHKIGDLQDEAAGVMEGILDFGIAGLRKGLRLTGLQESPTDKAETITKPSEGLSSITSTLGHVLSRKNSQSEENFGKMDSQIDKNNTHKGSEPVDISKSNNSQHLVKQQRVTSQDSSYFNTVSKERDSHLKEMESSSFKDEGSLPSSYLDAIAPGTDSPEYEYEEPADFASTIAKLRHLLQQKTSDITPKTQDDSNIPDVTHSMIQSPHSKPASATQPTNSPIHKITPPQTGNSVVTTKSEEIVSSPSIDGDFGFTILSQNSSELVEAEEALNHKIEQISLMNVPQANVNNNMQRLDKLFTRTVTGVFNTIKTAVGGDSLAEGVSGHPEMVLSVIDKQTLVRPHQHKDDWIFVEGEMEVSKIVSKLLMERRGFCVVETEVEAGQDMLEVLGTPKGHPDNMSSTPTSPCVNDDLDESEVLFGCPVYQMCMELVAVILGGIMQKDAVVKCISIVVADMLEDVFQNKVKQLNTWLGRWIVGALHSLHSENEESQNVKSDDLESHNVSIEMNQLRDELLTIIPDILFTILGKEEMDQAIAMLLSSVEYSLINRDLVFNLLDVFMLHFSKACSNQNSISTPPPSA